MKYFVEGTEDLTPRYIYRKKRVATIDVQDGVVNITDPGYDDLDKCGITVRVKPGTYKCYIDLVDFPYNVQYEEDDYEVKIGRKQAGEIEVKHDNRIASTYILHEDYTKFVPEEYWDEIGNIGVDAGLAGFYNHKPIYDTEEKWTAFCDTLRTLEEYPAITCDAKRRGFTTSSGDGDGCYLVYAAKHKEDIVSLKISFYD